MYFKSACLYTMYVNVYINIMNLIFSSFLIAYKHIVPTYIIMLQHFIRTQNMSTFTCIHVIMIIHIDIDRIFNTHYEYDCIYIYMNLEYLNHL